MLKDWARRLSWGLSLALLLALPGFGRADSDALEAASAVHETLAVNYVIVPFVVYNSQGRPLRDLRPTEVSLIVDGNRVDTDMFYRTSNGPVSFTFLVDGSGSMALAGKIDGARHAIREIIRQRRKDDDFALFVFAEGQIREAVPFTQDGARLIEAVDHIKPYGQTALYDALLAMPDRTLLGRNGSRVIILLTDGLDNASKLDQGALARAFQGVEVPVYPVGLRSARSLATSNREESIDISVLAGLAGMSGGRLAIADDETNLKSAVRAILDDLRAQYLLGFAPNGAGAIRYRQISLRFARPVHSVRVRAGYRGTEPPTLQKRN